MKIESESEIKEFIGSLLDTTKPANKKFLNELLVKLKRPSEFSDVTVYVKPKMTEDTSSKFKQNKNHPASNKTESDDSQASLVNQPPKKNGFKLFSYKIEIFKKISTYSNPQLLTSNQTDHWKNTCVVLTNFLFRFTFVIRVVKREKLFSF